MSRIPCVAFQGEPGAYSESACKNMFGTNIRTMPLMLFEQVFDAVKSGKVPKAAIPIENSLAGSIHQNYDLLQQTDLKIITETQLRIEHVLVCHPDSSLRKIKRVISHPQALSQCSNFFKRRRSVQAVAFYDTAGAAKEVAASGDVSMGAIASIHAARNYKLKILRRNLENNHLNFTRFLGISKKANKKVMGKMKTSLCFEAKKEETGVLFKMLGVFALRNINLLKIESRPIPKRTFEYIFYLDLEGHPGQKHVKNAIEQLGDMASRLLCFGAYPQGTKTFIQ